MIDGIASMNGTANLVDYPNFQEAIQASYGGTRAEVPEEYRKRSAEFAVDRLTMPIGLAVSGKDTSVPPHSVLRLAQALQALVHPVLLIFREDLGHVTTYDDALAILDHMLTHARPPTTAP
jgi:dipeptidyl aminopeptidase/acylaminoacyl peptidase